MIETMLYRETAKKAHNKQKRKVAFRVGCLSFSLFFSDEISMQNQTVQLPHRQTENGIYRVIEGENEVRSVMT